jgi:AGZA family xanthine/uracil permease-like MFS transporter
MKNRMERLTLWLALVGFVIISYCLMKNIKGAMIYGIVFLTTISWYTTIAVMLFSDTKLDNLGLLLFRKDSGCAFY